MNMTISNKSLKKYLPKMPGSGARVGALVLVLGSVVGLSGCSSLGSLFGDKVDYKSAGKAQPLDVPPDLTRLQKENRYAIPETNRGTATASSYSLQQQGALASGVNEPIAQGSNQIAPRALGEIRIERAGNQRWLVLNQKPEVLYPLVKEFWLDSGFLINTELPDVGVMETDWAENRAKIPQDVLRKTLGRVLDSLYSTGERDKFRTRLERTASGGTEIYISHRGAEEVLVGQNRDTTSWTARASDPGLEAEFLTRLMLRLGIAREQATAAVKGATAPALQAKLVQAPNATYVEVDEGYDRAWRRIGLALDRVGFTVEDRDRIQGIYFVRFVDIGTDAQGKAVPEKGFLGRLFSFGKSDKDKDGERFQIAVKSGSNVNTTQVFVLGNDGKPATSANGSKILNLLNDQLK
jgi:outer membrane protein assembly factor BamC